MDTGVHKPIPSSRHGLFKMQIRPYTGILLARVADRRRHGNGTDQRSAKAASTIKHVGRQTERQREIYYILVYVLDKINMNIYTKSDVK